VWHSYNSINPIKLFSSSVGPYLAQFLECGVYLFGEYLHLLNCPMTSEMGEMIISNIQYYLSYSCVFIVHWKILRRIQIGVSRSVCGPWNNWYGNFTWKRTRWGGIRPQGIEHCTQGHDTKFCHAQSQIQGNASKKYLRKKGFLQKQSHWWIYW
jgi:hypothetical protein